MADKSRTTFPIAVDFVDGELPNAAKMNGLARQTRQGLGVLEHIIGDAWNQSGDSVFQSVEDAHNMIPNIARYLGSSRLVNPRIPYLPDIEEYTHKFDNAASTYEAQLPFPPAAGTTYVWSGGASLDAVPVATKGLVVATGNWWIDTSSGRIVTYDQIQSAWKLTYKPVVDCDLGNDATWNMIPDPDTDASWAFRSVKIEYKNGTDDSEGYLIFLPPRGPLDLRRINVSPQDDVHTVGGAENYQIAPSSGTKRFWQDDSVAADTGIDAEHYRYLLPKILTDNWGQASTIPAGFVYLYDPTNTRTIIEGLILSAEDTAVPRKFVLRATGGNLSSYLSGQGATQYPEANLTDQGNHAASQYPSNGLRLITIGTSVSAAFSQIVEHFLNHDHGTPSSLMSAPVSHDKLADTFDADGFTPQLDPSGLTADSHPQYLHRSGYNTSRDKFNNAMLGDLIMGATGSDGNYQNESTDSHKVYFGSITGSRLYHNNVTGVIHLDAGTDTYGFRINEPTNSNSIGFQNGKGGTLESWISVNNKLNLDIGGELDLEADAHIKIESALNTTGEGILVQTTNNGDINVVADGASNNADISLDAAGGVALLARNENIDIEATAGDATLVAGGNISLTSGSVTENILVPLICNSSNAPLVSGTDGAAYVFSSNVATMFSIGNVFPHLCTVNSVKINFQHTNIGGTTSSIVIDRLDYGGSPPKNNMVTTTFGTLSGLTNFNSTANIGLSSFNVGLSRASHLITMSIDPDSGFSLFRLYPYVQLNVTYSKLLHWPANT